MAYSTWTDLCKQPTLKASSAKYAKPVYDSTIQLHQSLEPILSALNRHAIGLTKCTNYDAALRDADLMQQLSPSSPLGYIREATIYSEQGKQLEVIRICNHGLSIVDTMDTHYDTLQRAKMDAEQQQSKRIDFISQVPLDIVMTTLIPMFTGDLVLHSSKPTLFLHVSNVWRDRIIQHFGGLFFQIGDDEDANLSRVIVLSHCIEELEVDYYSKGTWLGDLLRNHDFCSLQELHITYASPNCIDHLISSLKSVSNILTQFTIAHDGNTMLPIEEILVTCPNLVSLNITQPNAADISSLSMTTWPKLTTLTTSSDDVITCDEVMAIGKRFPSLNSHHFASCEEMESIRIALDYYPWMNNIGFHEFGRDLALVSTMMVADTKTLGLRDLLSARDT
ncbi:predicted protein [Lichtheimia corymbifera JMRC:FSU:9682]|uniref:F-box domain-containing protein n=1 Tax=Lichtheimia corymbifera JMRC:FSU:9682 TaxID=1263082 RepID=A0A068S749_9FUNG|nr:predicted protein [Lichtheimia corymbifera JMRC:FSU:9682]